MGWMRTGHLGRELETQRRPPFLPEPPPLTDCLVAEINGPDTLNPNRLNVLLHLLDAFAVVNDLLNQRLGVDTLNQWLRVETLPDGRTKRESFGTESCSVTTDRNERSANGDDSRRTHAKTRPATGLRSNGEAEQHKQSDNESRH